jgi:hypothetical protein
MRSYFGPTGGSQKEVSEGHKNSRRLKPNTFANFEVPAKIAHRNFFFAISGVVNPKKNNN